MTSVTRVFQPLAINYYVIDHPQTYTINDTKYNRCEETHGNITWSTLFYFVSYNISLFYF